MPFERGALISEPAADVHLPSRLPAAFWRVEIETPPVMDCPSVNSQSLTSPVWIVTASPRFSPMSSTGSFPSAPEIVPLPKAVNGFNYREIKKIQAGS